MRTNRRKLMLAKFKNIEFVYNNGAYIDTGLPEGDYVFNIKCATLETSPWVFQFVKSQKATGNADRYYCGINNDIGNGDKRHKLICQGCGATFDNFKAINTLVPTDENIFEFQLGTNPYTYWLKLNGKYIISPKQGKKDYFKDKTVKLFFDDAFLCYGKIYYIRIYSSDRKDIIQDYVPVINIHTGKAGLLEKVHNKFYNKGTNEFEFTEC